MQQCYSVYQLAYNSCYRKDIFLVHVFLRVHALLDVLFDPCSRNPGEKSVKWMIIDALIIAAIAAVARLPETIPTIEDIYVIVKTFLYSFLLQLAVERGVKPHIKKVK